VPDGLLLFFKLQALMGAAFWLGLFWRRTTVAGAWVSTVVGFLIFFATSQEGFHTWAVEALPESMVWDGKFRDSWQIFFMLTGGFGSGILVSLFTRRVKDEKLERVYRALRTPVNEEEPPHPEPFVIPEGIVIPEPRKLINHPDLEIPMPTAVGMGGFAFFWAWVAGLIAFVFWMATWGT
jgi:hypothetical protein